MICSHNPPCRDNRAHIDRLTSHIVKTPARNVARFKLWNEVDGPLVIERKDVAA